MSSPHVVDQHVPPQPRWIAPVSVAAFITLLAVTLGAGLLFRLGALTPSNVFASATINTVFTVHSSSALFLSHAILLGFVAQVDHRKRTLVRTFLPISLLVITYATVTAVVTMQVEATRPLVWTIASIYMFLGGYAVATTGPAAPKMSWGITIAGIAHILTGIGFFGGIMASGRWSLDVLMAASLAIIAQEASGKLGISSRVVLVGVGCSTVARSFSDSAVLEFVGFWGPLAMAYILVAEARAAVRLVKPEHAWSRRYYTLAIMTFVQAVLLRACLNAVNFKTLGDTLFAVGTVHLEYFTSAWALLGLLHRDWESKGNGRKRERLAWAAFVLLAIGMQVMVWGFVALGRRGMPRRMGQYLEQFQGLHIVCTMGAILLVIGIALAISALLPIALADVQRERGDEHRAT